MNQSLNIAAAAAAADLLSQFGIALLSLEKERLECCAQSGGLGRNNIAARHTLLNSASHINSGWITTVNIIPYQHGRCINDAQLTPSGAFSRSGSRNTSKRRSQFFFNFSEQRWWNRNQHAIVFITFFISFFIITFRYATVIFLIITSWNGT